MFQRSMLAAAALLAGLSLASAQAPAPASAGTATLVPGAQSPAPTIAQWVKGAPVPAFQKGKVYVVEFWATWCGPCIASMPHLSALQRAYRDKGVTFIGVTSEDPHNDLGAVEAMVKAKGDGMDYTVAWDSGRKTNEAYMTAAGQGGIPCSFLIDGAGRIAYIGHPIMLDLPVSQVVAGTWDVEK